MKQGLKVDNSYCKKFLTFFLSPSNNGLTFVFKDYIKHAFILQIK